MRKFIWILCGALALALAPLGAEAVSDGPLLPPLGPWLLDPDGNPAHWLGAKVDGKTLVEPINVAVVDARSGSADEATNKLLGEIGARGFGEKGGHSSGYWAVIGTEQFPQISNHDDTAISDGQSYQANNHGRLFGPLADGGRFVFVGAFSREAFDPFGRVHHRFVSFNQAREAFARSLVSGSAYRLAGYVPVGNSLTGDPSTADHDGTIVVLEAVR